jgi:hypothetical protein
MPDDRRVLEDIERLVVDGTNVLHVLGRSPEPAPPAALVGRLRAIVPPGVAVIVVLDGSPSHGLVARQVASGVQVRYAGRATADEAIIHLVEHEFAESSVGTLVVTDDQGLAGAVRRLGARTVRNGWLVSRLARQRMEAPSVGRPAPRVQGLGSGGQAAATRRPAGATPRTPRKPSGPQLPPGEAAAAAKDEDEAARWEPGRGATHKRGNPKRRPTTGR